jgi:hypothetical protein
MAGEMFQDILQDPDEQDAAKPAPRRKVTSEPDPLAQAGLATMKGGGKVSIGDPSGQPSRMHAQEAAGAVSEQQAFGEAEQRRQRQQAGTAAFMEKYNAQEQRDKQMVAKYGTADRDLAAKVEATGVFDQDFQRRMQLDPEGGRAAADRALTLLGKNGASEVAGMANVPTANVLTTSGLIQPGNLDLSVRPRVKNPDGSISTIRSMSFNEDGKEVLIPTVSKEGKVLSNTDAITLYHKTGEHLGKFDTPENATSYAQQLHEREASGQGSKPPGRQYSEGTGAHGERYFTNLSPTELKQEKHAREDISGRKEAPPITGLRALGLHDQPGAEVAPRTPEQDLFQGRVNEMQGIAEGPERSFKHLKNADMYLQELLSYGQDQEHGAKGARDKLHDDVMSGVLKARGLTPRDAYAADQFLTKHTKEDYYTDPSIDRTLYMPPAGRKSKPGIAEDKAQPATVLNPGGGLTDTDRAAQDHAKVKADRDSYVDDTTPTELPTAFQYAKGTVPSPQPTPGSPQGRGWRPAGAGSSEAGFDILAGRKAKREKGKKEYEDYKKSGGKASLFMELFGGE